MEKINNNKIYLPAIQRRFVWSTWQIEKLFDSIMRGYPIGTFIFWQVTKDKADEYLFYKFLKDYHERDRFTNELAPKPEMNKEILGVLDGQQRLNSMYVSLQGTYTIKKNHARWDDNSAFVIIDLYINLIKDIDPKEDGEEQDDKGEEQNFTSEFKFLTKDAAKKIDEKNLWFPVREVLKLDPGEKVDQFYDSWVKEKNCDEKTKNILESKKSMAISNLDILHKRIVTDKLINFYTVQKTDLDEVLDIFIRVNSYGKQLTKTDLLLATIASIWDKGREEIENYIKELNKKGDGFSFDNDFIMRACLVLTDSPVLFKVKGFSSKNITNIMNQWEQIKLAIDKTVNLLVEFGLNGGNLSSQNSIIPIAYFIKNGGDINSSKGDLKRYLLIALWKQVYGGQGDSVLSIMRNAIKNMLQNSSKHFTFELLKEKLPNQKSLAITDEDIDDILEENKSPLTFSFLSFLYPNLKYGQVKFHQDHIHPVSMFCESKFKQLGIDEKSWDEYKEKKDKLPNLQLMEGTENEEKNSKPFIEWLNGNDKSGRPYVPDVDKYKKDNYIPPNVSLDFKDFLTFYVARGKMIKEELKRLLE